MSQTVSSTTDARSDSPTRTEVGDDPTPPEERGGLEIDRGVLRRIAEHAADGSPHSVTVRRRGAGLNRTEQGAQARLSGPEQELRVRLELAVRYPDPVPESVRDISERVGDQLRRLAGCQVRSVDVVVSALVPDRKPPRVE